jgi:hypothetical protein
LNGFSSQLCAVHFASTPNDQKKENFNGGTGKTFAKEFSNPFKSILHR